MDRIINNGKKIKEHIKHNDRWFICFRQNVNEKKHVSWIHEKCHGNFEVPFHHLTYPNTDHYNLVLPEKEKKKPGLTAKIDFVAKWSKCA